jgi:uncharacterized phiE125 gp8 family phage protein
VIYYYSRCGSHYVYRRNDAGLGENIRLTVTSPPQTIDEPLTVEEMREYLRLPTYSPPDTAGDDLIASMISAARETAELWTYQNRDLVGRQWDKRLNRFPAYEIPLRDPLSTVDLVEFKDYDGTTTTLTEGTDYIVDTNQNLILPAPGTSWPTDTLWPVSAVLVRFTTSDYAIPAMVKNGMKLLISDWHTLRLPFDPIAARREDPNAPNAVSAAFRSGRYVGDSV